MVGDDAINGNRWSPHLPPTTQHPRPMNLQPLLEDAVDQCSPEERLAEDPVGLVRPYERAEDREVAGLFASCLAYGRVDLLRPAVREALEPLGARPATRLREATDEQLREWWTGFNYRMTNGPDLRDLAFGLRTTLRTEGSIEALYLGDRADDAPVTGPDEHLERASHLVHTLRSRRLRPDLERGFRYLLVDPADGSACKRLHLYFRWMVRGPDDVDMGLWDGVAPSALLMPLDTHTGRLCRYLGLLERKTIDGKAARIVAENLAEFDADDPLRYDFALCHLGISDRCIHRRCPDRCPSCPIEPACVLPGEAPSES